MRIGVKTHPRMGLYGSEGPSAFGVAPWEDLENLELERLVYVGDPLLERLTLLCYQAFRMPAARPRIFLVKCKSGVTIPVRASWSVSWDLVAQEMNLKFAPFNKHRTPAMCRTHWMEITRDAAKRFSESVFQQESNAVPSNEALDLATKLSQLPEFVPSSAPVPRRCVEITSTASSILPSLSKAVDDNPAPDLPPGSSSDSPSLRRRVQGLAASVLGQSEKTQCNEPGTTAIRPSKKLTQFSESLGVSDQVALEGLCAGSSLDQLSTNFEDEHLSPLLSESGKIVEQLARSKWFSSDLLATNLAIHQIMSGNVSHKLADLPLDQQKAVRELLHTWRFGLKLESVHETVVDHLYFLELRRLGSLLNHFGVTMKRRSELNTRAQSLFTSDQRLISHVVNLLSKQPISPQMLNANTVADLLKTNQLALTSDLLPPHQTQLHFRKDPKLEADQDAFPFSACSAKGTPLDLLHQRITDILTRPLQANQLPTPPTFFENPMTVHKTSTFRFNLAHSSGAALSLCPLLSPAIVQMSGTIPEAVARSCSLIPRADFLLQCLRSLYSRMSQTEKVTPGDWSFLQDSRLAPFVRALIAPRKLSPKVPPEAQPQERGGPPPQPSAARDQTAPNQPWLPSMTQMARPLFVPPEAQDYRTNAARRGFLLPGSIGQQQQQQLDAMGAAGRPGMAQQQPQLQAGAQAKFHSPSPKQFYGLGGRPTQQTAPPGIGQTNLPAQDFHAFAAAHQAAAVAAAAAVQLAPPGINPSQMMGRFFADPSSMHRFGAAPTATTSLLPTGLNSRPVSAAASVVPSMPGYFRGMAPLQQQQQLQQQFQQQQQRQLQLQQQQQQSQQQQSLAQQYYRVQLRGLTPPSNTPPTGSEEALASSDNNGWTSKPQVSTQLFLPNSNAAAAAVAAAAAQQQQQSQSQTNFQRLIQQQLMAQTQLGASGGAGRGFAGAAALSQQQTHQQQQQQIQQQIQQQRGVVQHPHLWRPVNQQSFLPRQVQSSGTATPESASQTGYMDPQQMLLYQQRSLRHTGMGTESPSSQSQTRYAPGGWTSARGAPAPPGSSPSANWPPDPNQSRTDTPQTATISPAQSGFLTPPTPTQSNEQMLFHRAGPAEQQRVAQPKVNIMASYQANKQSGFQQLQQQYTQMQQQQQQQQFQPQQQLNQPFQAQLRQWGPTPATASYGSQRPTQGSQTPTQQMLNPAVAYHNQQQAFLRAAAAAGQQQSQYVLQQQQQQQQAMLQFAQAMQQQQQLSSRSSGSSPARGQSKPPSPRSAI